MGKREAGGGGVAFAACCSAVRACVRVNCLPCCARRPPYCWGVCACVRARARKLVNGEDEKRTQKEKEKKNRQVFFFSPALHSPSATRPRDRRAPRPVLNPSLFPFPASAPSKSNKVSETSPARWGWRGRPGGERPALVCVRRLGAPPIRGRKKPTGGCPLPSTKGARALTPLDLGVPTHPPVGWEVFSQHAWGARIVRGGHGRGALRHSHQRTRLQRAHARARAPPPPTLTHSHLPPPPPLRPPSHTQKDNALPPHLHPGRGGGPGPVQPGRRRQWCVFL